MDAKRGQCTVCRYRFRLLKDGTLQRHHLYSGSEKQPECAGSRKPPQPFSPDECGACLEYRFTTPGLMEACFSVGIENGRDGNALMFDILAAFHESGHLTETEAGP